MHWVRPAAALGKLPLRLVWLPTIDSPLVPMPMALLERGVREALPVIERGDRVLVHCHFGIHRSVAMACCVLIGMGYSAEEAMAQVKNRRALADPQAPHIRKRILLFARSWDGNRTGAHSEDEDIG
jgi:protein-tyrosine phosphatase